MPVSKRIARDIRGDAVRARTQSSYTLEIHGEKASAMWTCTTCIESNTSTTVMKASARLEKRTRDDGDHPYMKRWWVPGLQIGYEHTFIHQFAIFLQALGEGKQASPTFKEGLATDYVTDAVLKSAKTRQWEGVEHVH